MNSTIATMPCTWAYIEMMRGRRDDCRCRKCGWFSHIAHHCRQREILEERRRKSACEGNKFTPLLSKVCRRMERGYVVCLQEGKVQPTRCCGCGEARHIL